MRIRWAISGHRRFAVASIPAHALISLVAVVLFCSPCAATAAAQPASGGAAGVVLADDGSPIGGAEVTLSGGGIRRTASTSSSGGFALAALTPGSYLVLVTAKGYATLRDRTVDVRAGQTIAMRLVMTIAPASSLTVLGRVSVNGADSLSTASAPSVDINAQRYAARGITRVSDVLESRLSTTVIPVIGGGLNAPASVALRGGDPSETLVDIDGHQVNNGNTGDFDVSLLDPADLQSVEVVYGIAPSSLIGPDTIGGAINIRTLEPTTQLHSLLRLTGSSYATFGETLQVTGSQDPIGYALSVHRVT